MVYRAAVRRRPQGRKLKRRWYAEATIGKNVPFLGGTGIRFGNNNVRGLVKREALKQEETKKRVIALPSIGLTHDELYVSKLNWLANGTGGDQKTGDRVFYCGLNIKYEIRQSVAGGGKVLPTMYRILVIRSRVQYPTVTGDALLGAVVPTTDIYRGTGGMSLAYINSDKVTVLCSKVVQIKARADATETVYHQGRLNCKIMKQFQFRTAQQDGEYFNYYLVVHPHMHNLAVVSGSTVYSNIDVLTEQIFKDA